MADARHVAGAAAEQRALEHLTTAGLRLLERNARFRAGEWDLVMTEGETLVFVEVRLRQHLQFGGPLASVDWRKQRKLARAAALWLQRHPEQSQRRARFDVVGFTSPTAPPAWVRDAWRTT
jgi:putative endonuclease